jgi:hypothetical protein
LLYADLDKLEDAEKMYQRALQSYEKAFGIHNATAYILAPNKIKNLSLLFEPQADLVNARIMYIRALAGNGKLFGFDHSRSLDLRDRTSCLRCYGRYLS